MASNKEIPMKKYLIAAALLGALATPVLAAEGFYIVFDNTTKKCTMMNEAYRHEPLQDDGHLGEAKAAVAGIKECKM